MLSVTEANAALSRAHTRDMRHKQTMAQLEGALVRKASGVFTSGVLGSMAIYGVPVDIKGFPWKLGVWTAATLTEAMTSGMVQKAAGGVGDATMAIYTYLAITRKTVVAGGEF
jgi:hypothetical protein